MKRRLRPTPALVVACVALLVALAGTGYAALKLPRNSFIKDKWFRWGYEPGGPGWHCHMAPVMKYKLPRDLKTWFYHTKHLLGL